MTRKLTTAALTLALGTLVGTADASFTLQDPGNAQTVGINSAGRTMDADIGNTSLAAFDALDNYTFDFASTQTGYTNDNLPIFLKLTAGASGADLDANVTANGGGYAVYSGTQSAAYTTSGGEALVTTRSEIVIDVTNGDVDGIGFTINRSIAEANVKLFDADDNAIGNAAGYTVAANTNHRFFGYTRTGGDALISKVTITGLGGGQVGLDDVSFVIPEPGSMALIGLGGLALIARRRKD